MPPRCRWLELKQAGNESFKKGQYGEASERYSQAIKEFEKSGGFVSADQVMFHVFISGLGWLESLVAAMYDCTSILGLPSSLFVCDICLPSYTILCERQDSIWSLNKHFLPVQARRAQRT